jgi:hypothetical protein
VSAVPLAMPSTGPFPPWLYLFPTHPSLAPVLTLPLA